MQDANPVCAFSGTWPSDSVFGARYPALSVDPVRVPGPRCQYPEPGTWHQPPVFEKPAHGVCRIQDAGRERQV